MLRLMLATTTAGSAGPTATNGACKTYNVTVNVVLFCLLKHDVQSLVSRVHALHPM